jgi:rfaE bifunctional protein kinase chain/domain
MNKPTAESIAIAFSDMKVLIIGDVMIDSYLWGRVDRISPEAPVPILLVQERDTRLGGAANVALNVQALGATPVLCSVIGDDADGQLLLSLLHKNDLSSEGIVKADGRITTIKHRIMSGANHMLRVDQETDVLVSDVVAKQLVKKACELIPECDVVIFEDYDKGVLSKEIISEIISFCKSKNIPTVIDPKKRNFLHYTGATLFKPNRKEMREGLKLDHSLTTSTQVEAASDQLKTVMPVDGILITLSEKGVYIDSKNQKHHIPAHLREIADVSGAGDTVVSVAALCLAMGLEPSLVAELSNLSGGLVCEQVGVVPVNLEELLSEAQRLKMIN